MSESIDDIVKKHRLRRGYGDVQTPVLPTPEETKTPLTYEKIKEAEKIAVKGTGQFFLGLLKGVPQLGWDTLKSIYTSTIGQNLWAVTGQKGKSPLQKRWEKGQEEVTQLSRAIGAGKFAERHPTMAWTTGPLQSILDLTMIGGMLPKAKIITKAGEVAKVEMAITPKGVVKTFPRLEKGLKQVKGGMAKVITKEDTVSEALRVLADKNNFSNFWTNTMKQVYTAKRGIINRGKQIRKFLPKENDRQYQEWIERIPQFKAYLEGKPVTEITKNWSPETVKTLEWIYDIQKGLSQNSLKRGRLKLEQIWEREVGPIKKYLGEKIKVGKKEMTVEEAVKESGLDPAYFSWMHEDKMNLSDIFIPKPLMKRKWASFLMPWKGVLEGREKTDFVSVFSRRRMEETVTDINNSMVDNIVSRWGRGVRMVADKTGKLVPYEKDGKYYLDSIPSQISQKVNTLKIAKEQIGGVGKFRKWDFEGYRRFYPQKVYQYIKDPKIIKFIGEKRATWLYEAGYTLEDVSKMSPKKLAEVFYDGFGKFDKIAQNTKALQKMINEAKSLWDEFGEVGYKTEIKGIGVSKDVPSVLVPDYVYKTFFKYQQSAGTAEKIARKIYDPIIDVWRFSVLSLSPRWYINNTLGNYILNSVGGMHPFSLKGWEAYGKALLPKWKNLIPKKVAEKVKGGFYEAERGGFMAGESLPERLLSAPMKFNQMIEGYFRRANYLYKTEQLARVKVNKILSYQKLATENMRKTFSRHDMDGMIKQLIKKDSKIQEAGIKNVNKFLNDYTKLSFKERSIVRRIVPFYSWYKHLFKLTSNLALEDPKRLIILYRMYQTLGPVEDKDAPEWMKGRLATPFFMLDYVGNEVPLWASVKGIMPFSDILKFNSGNAILSAINPVAKVAIERMVRTDLFRGKEFTSPYYNPYTGLLCDKNLGKCSQEKPLPDLMWHISQQFPTFQFIDDLIRPYAKYTATGEVIKNSKTGEPLYDKNALLTLLKMFGLNFMPYDMEKGFKEQMKKEIQSKKYIKKKINKEEK